jgi:CubicO group peptidase (beta-lactamase class C family)
MHRTGIAWIAVLAGAGPLFGQAASVDDYIRESMKKQKIPGLSVAIVRDGEVIKAEGYGLANVELNVPATKDTMYQSGSVGKQVTSAAVMVLVEDGKLKLDDPISKYLEDSPEIWKDITIHHLLTHTSGIKDYTMQLNLRKDYSDEELVKLAAKNKLDFPPGEQWRYSNTGYALLGIIVTKVAGKFYGDLLKERVFDPLGMTTARMQSESDIIPNRAAGYRLSGGKYKNQEYVSPTLNRTADGSLVFTVLDMAKWDAGLYGETALRKTSLDRSWTPVKLSNGRSVPYGFGWAIGDRRGHREIEHGGAWQGFQTHISRFVDDKLTVIVLTNLVGSDPTSLARGIAGYYEPALQPLSALAPQADPAPTKTERFARVVAELADGKIDSFSPEWRANFEKLNAGDKSRASRPFKDVKELAYLATDDVSARTLERNGARVSRLAHYKAEKGKRPIYLTFYLTADGSIVDVDVSAN